MLPGVTFYEPIFLEASPADLLRDLGITSLELSPHDSRLPVTAARAILKQLAVLPTLTMHLPYHLEPSWHADFFDPSLLSITQPLIRWLEEVSLLAEDQDQPVPLTLHGASTAESLKITYRMLDWFANTIERRDLPLRPSLENLYAREEQPFGHTAQVHRALRDFSPLLGWTWDLTHDFRRRGHFHAPEKEMLAALTHVHLHGYDSNRDHLFIGSGEPFYEPYLALLEKEQVVRPLILEVLFERNYTEQMRIDLNSLKKSHNKTR